MKSVLQKIARVALPVFVVAVSILGARALIASRPEAARKPQQAMGTVVETTVVQSQTHPVTVQAQGSVVPAQEVTLQAEVTGRIQWLHPRLVAGGRVRKGEVLLRIDARDYALSLQQQKGEVDRAQLEVELEQSRKAVAEREWELFAEDAPANDASGAALALREPQLRTAKVALESAQSSLERAQLQLERTRVTAPFNAIVRTEAIEVGQLVTPNTTLGTLVGSDVFWVQLSLPLADLQWLDIPGVNATEGSRAKVIQEAGRQHVVRHGRIVRLLGDLDPVGRMARVLVAIPSPLDGADADAPPGLPLLLGAYVRVELQGKEVQDAIEVPRIALHDGDHVYVVSAEHTLEIRNVHVLHRGPDSVLVTDGIRNGERIVTSHIAAPVEGMPLRLAEIEAKEGSEAAERTTVQKRPHARSEAKAHRATP